MFEALGRSLARRPRRALALWLVVTLLGVAVALVGVTGENLFERLESGDTPVAGSQSTEGNEILATQDTTGESVTMIVSGVDLADPGLATTMAGVNASVSEVTGVASVIDPFILPDGLQSPAAAPLLTQGGDGFIVVTELAASLTEDESAGVMDEVVEALRAAGGTIAAVQPEAETLVGSTSLIVDAITDQVQQDLQTGEAVALPVALVIMVLVFGGFLAAAMPMAGAIASIGAGLGVLYALSFALDVDASVVNVVTLVSIGLSIDYGLLIVSRFREELAAATGGEATTSRRRRAESPATQALVRTMATAGRTVAFSALTIAISIAGLMVFRPEILRAIGAAGLAIVLIAVGTALTLVPALLMLTGTRLARPGVLAKVRPLRKVLATTADVETDEGVFSRLAVRVQRHPWIVLVSSVVVLVVLALPVASLHMRNSGIELLPASAPQREFVRELAAEYPDAAGSDLVIVTQTTLEAATAWTATLAGVSGVEAVEGPTALGSYAVIGVDAAGTDPGGPEASALVRELRTLDPGFEYWVTGQAAGQVDFTDALTERAPLAVTVVVLATFVLLFLMTGSVVVPIKALLTNALSLAASMGVLVWAFQYGHLEGLLGFESTGGIETYVVALVIAFAFGLAMDYEVFLLARIKELYDSGLDNDAAVRVGMQRSGRIITSAAAIIVVVFAGFVFGDLLVIKEVGFALAFAVLLDATLVRLLLVPATMTLLGRWNWWAPAPLRRLHERFALTH